MRQFVARRVAASLGVLAAASVVIFLLVAAAPGDPAKLVAERAGASDHAAVERARHHLGLDRPLPERYADWVVGAVRGDLGTSMRTGTPIGGDLAGRLHLTLLLVAGAAAFAVVAGIGVGVLGALRPRGVFDRLSRAGALLGVSIPNFYLGAVLVLLFAVSLHWVSAGGESGPTSWLLPWVTLGLAPAGVLARVVRVGLAEALSRPYVITALSKGASRRRIVLRDALPNIAVPTLTALGAQTGLMVIGAAVVETVFSWQGAALYFLEAVKFRDFPVLQASLLMFAAIVIVVNTAVDITAYAIDPRLRRATTEALA